jgi:hypothetical protein
MRSNRYARRDATPPAINGVVEGTRASHRDGETAVIPLDDIVTRWQRIVPLEAGPPKRGEGNLKRLGPPSLLVSDVCGLMDAQPIGPSVR